MHRVILMQPAMRYGNARVGFVERGTDDFSMSDTAQEARNYTDRAYKPRGSCWTPAESAMHRKVENAYLDGYNAAKRENAAPRGGCAR